jgi:CCR4-NOT complex subunit CAF16
MAEPAAVVRGLTVVPAGCAVPALDDVSLSLPAAARCVLVGSEGAGKSTLLAALAGRVAAIPAGALAIGGHDAGDPGALTDVALLAGPLPPPLEITVGERFTALGAAAVPERSEALCEAFGLAQPEPQASLSPRRRRALEVALALAAPRRLYLVDDDATADLDLVARANLLRWLRKETERGAAVMLATHVFDGLEDWATHLAFLDRGRLRLFAPVDHIKELDELREAGEKSALYRLVERLLRD